jgi:hypothetical protein
VEVQQVFRRAAELQKAGPVGLADLRELSLQELEQIAATAGIDVQQLHRAILELDAQAVRERVHLLGAAPRVVLERVVPNQVSTGGLQNLAGEIRRSLGEDGQISTIGSALKWSSPNTSSGPVEITVSSAAERTLIQIRARFGGLIGATFGGIGGVLGAGVGLLLAASVGQLTHSAWAGALVGVAAVGLALLLARSIYGAIVRRRITQLGELLGRLSQLATAAGEHTAE